MRIPDSSKSYFGKICRKHPELLGHRRRSSFTCVQCCRDAKKASWAAKLIAQGKSRRILYSPQEAAERIRLRDLARNAVRRKCQDYNASQIERKRRWRVKHHDRHLATNRAYDALQLRENLQRRLSKNLRHRIYKAMFGKTRGVSAVRDLGMSIAEFREHIQRQFTQGMAWENYGKWHLDHRRPLASFDLTDNEQARAACHYTNLQPLWAPDNIRKHSKQAWEAVV